jgi:hypothetical protein
MSGMTAWEPCRSELAVLRERWRSCLYPKFAAHVPERGSKLF